MGLALASKPLPPAFILLEDEGWVKFCTHPLIFQERDYDIIPVIDSTGVSCIPHADTVLLEPVAEAFRAHSVHVVAVGLVQVVDVTPRESADIDNQHTLAYLVRVPEHDLRTNVRKVKPRMFRQDCPLSWRVVTNVVLCCACVGMPGSNRKGTQCSPCAHT